MPIAKMAEVMPEAFKQFQKICATLEKHYRDMQDSGGRACAHSRR
jgi:pyruvate,orthophosphate dikinase